MIDYKDPKAVLEVCGKATEGPWIRSRFGFNILTHDSELSTCTQRYTGKKRPTEGEIAVMEANADFIILARTALPYWVEEAERLRKLYSELVEKTLKINGIIPAIHLWTCIFCGFPNLQRHEVCERCGKERQG